MDRELFDMKECTGANSMQAIAAVSVLIWKFVILL